MEEPCVYPNSKGQSDRQTELGGLVRNISLTLERE
jgi:hypothetical protein